MNTKIAMSGLSILASLALMGGATFAFFSSTATSTGNVFGSGSLNLLLDDNNEVTPAATITASIGGTNLAPGSTVTGSISMHNGGNIDIAEVNLGSTETVLSSPDLAGKLNITSAQIGSNSTCTDGVAVTLPATLADLNGTTVDMSNSAITAGSTRYLCMTLTLDSGTDDTYQGKSITETFTFIGHQSLTQ